MQYVSTFLSHAHEDKPFVRQVADQLVRRGIVVWEDVDQLKVGRDLITAITQAIDETTAFVVFISEASLSSTWCEDELSHAIRLEQQQPELEQWIIPIFDGDPLKLIEASKVLRASHWRHPDGDEVRKPEIDASAGPDVVAAKIAERIYDLNGLATAPEVGVVMDQRGTGERVAEPYVPANLATVDIPTLVFRPDQSTRNDTQILKGKTWDTFAWDVLGALRTSLGPLRRSFTVRIGGDAQHALFFLLGRLFDRVTGVSLSCHSNDPNTNAPILNNRRWEEKELLRDGAPTRSSVAKALPRVALQHTLRLGVEAPVVALLLIRALKEHYLPEAVKHVQSSGAAVPPCVWLQPPSALQRADARQLVADVLVLVHQLRRDHGTREVRLYTDLPVNVMPLLASQLTHKDMPRLVFMEFDHDSAIAGRPIVEHYTALSMTISVGMPAPNEGDSSESAPVTQNP